MFLAYKNTAINYTASGTGNTVVLLHGFLETLAIWKPLEEPLSKTHRVVTIDLLGHGKTGCVEAVHSMPDMAHAVHAVLEHLGIKTASFVGHSMGGYVVLAYAQQYPEAIIGLCLLNSTSLADSAEKQHQRDRAVQAVQQNLGLFVKTAIPNLFYEASRPLYKAPLKRLIDEALKTPVQGIVAALEGMKRRDDNTLFFRNAPFKKLIITGQNDPLITTDAVADIACKTDIEVVTLLGGHMSYIEASQALLLALQQFLKTT